MQVQLYGSLSLTGKGHATDIASMMGLMGTNPVTFPIEEITSEIDKIRREKRLRLAGKYTIDFNPETSIKFNRKFLPFHPNVISCAGKRMEQALFKK